MKYVAIETETTGLNPFNGDRLVALACVPIVDNVIQTEYSFHSYINPGRNIPPEILKYISATDSKVESAPRFSDIANHFLKIIDGATLVILNAPFDLRFLVRELEVAGTQNIFDVPVIDTLQIARRLYPEERNNTDALSDRLGINHHEERYAALTGAVREAQIWLKLKDIKQFDAQTILVESILT